MLDSPPAPVTVPAAATSPAAGLGVRATRALLSPWARLTLLVTLLATAGASVLVWEPQRLLASGWPPQLAGVAAVLLFAAAYGLCAVAFVPRPLLNIAAGALF